MIPETSYALTPGGDYIAYQTLGAGPVDVVIARDGGYAMGRIWEELRPAYFYRRLAAWSRVVLFDIRGFGASDGYGVASKPVLETWVDDIGSVLDAVGSERAVVVGSSHGGQYALMFAATYPGRCAGLILVNAFARFLRDREYQPGLPVGLRERFMEEAISGWGNGGHIATWAPSLLGDEQFRQWYCLAQQSSIGPGSFARLFDALVDRDVRSTLPAVRVPTLVIHRGENRYAPVAHGRYLAEHIEGATYVELPGADHLEFVGDVDPMLDEIQQFVSGLSGSEPSGRVLATTMFTDLVDSTTRASKLGDERWRHILDTHDELGRRVVADHRGQLVKTTGDGMVAVFDGPARAITAANEILKATTTELDIEARAGLHTGEVEVRGADIGGISVHIAARIAALARRNEVLVSRTVKDLVTGSGLTFTDRGTHSLKGVPEQWQLFALEHPLQGSDPTAELVR